MFWVIVGYMFLFIFRPHEYWPVLGVLRIERIYMIIAMILLFVSREKRYIAHPVNSRVLAFFAVMVLAAMVALRGEDAFNATYDYFKLIVFFFMIVLTIKDEEQLRKLVIAYIVIMCLYVGKSEWEFFVHGRYIYRMGIMRLGGIDITYGDPNAFAASVIYSMPFAWALLHSDIQQRWLRWMLWAYAAMAMIAIVFTGSRSGFAATALFLLIIMLGSKQKFKSLFVVAAVIIIGWCIMPESLYTRYETIFVRGMEGQASADVSAEGRTEGLKQGFRLLQRYPVLGIGPGNFYYGWDGVERGGNAHNVYGQIMGELGALGVVAFITMIWTIYRTHRRVIAGTIELLRKREPVSPDKPVLLSVYMAKLTFLQYLSLASIYTIILMLFKGYADHNLYRFNWLWIGAFGILAAHSLKNIRAKVDLR